jgi:hypothetical protein
MAEFGKAVALGSKSAQAQLRDCERLASLRPRLAGLLAGRDQPADNAERLAFAELCRQAFEARYAFSARLYAEAFGVESGLADDPASAYRFYAATAAARAGCGQGRDATGLKELEKARWRAHALAWLQTELTVWRDLAQSNAWQTRAEVGQAVRVWLRNAGLAGVRDPAALATLPVTEREAWGKLWQEVEAVLADASTPAKAQVGQKSTASK